MPAPNIFHDHWNYSRALIKFDQTLDKHYLFFNIKKIILPSKRQTVLGDNIRLIQGNSSRIKNIEGVFIRLLILKET